MGTRYQGASFLAEAIAQWGHCVSTLHRHQRRQEAASVCLGSAAGGGGFLRLPAALWEPQWCEMETVRCLFLFRNFGFVEGETYNILKSGGVRVN